MKFMKFMKNGHIVEVTDPNTFNVFEREGFVAVSEQIDEKIELVKIAKNLGIKSAHLLGIDKLKEKIAEAGEENSPVL
jgi:hypothetical protein